MINIRITETIITGPSVRVGKYNSMSDKTHCHDASKWGMRFAWIKYSEVFVKSLLKMVAVALICWSAVAGQVAQAQGAGQLGVSPASQITWRIDATTGDVAVCFAVIEATIATAGALIKVMPILNKIGPIIYNVQIGAPITLAVLLDRAGLLEWEKALATVVITKALEAAGKAAGPALVLPDAAWKLIIDGAKQIVQTCTNIAYTFVSTGAAIIAVLTQPVACGSTTNNNAWIQCQSKCGSSSSAPQQAQTWGLPSSPACPATLVEGMRRLFLDHFSKFCKNRYCGTGGMTTSPPPISNFFQCKTLALPPLELNSLASTCERIVKSKKAVGQ